MIRPVSEADLEALVRLESVGAAHPWSRNSLAGHLEGRFACGWVLEADRVVGHLLGQCILDEAEIHTVVVHPEARRRGHGRQLVEHALACWSAAGVTVVHLEVRDDNGPAIALYEGLGFTGVGRRAGYYGDVDARLLSWRSP